MKVLDSQQPAYLHRFSAQTNQKQRGRIETMGEWCSRHPIYTTAAAVAVAGALVILGISAMDSTPAFREPREHAPRCCWGWCYGSDFCYK